MSEVGDQKCCFPFLLPTSYFLLWIVQQILGIRFFGGSATEAVAQAIAGGGLIVAPSGTCFTRLQRDEIYRRAITGADLALPDSGFMVLLWRFLRGRRIPRISGLAYLKRLLAGPDLRFAGSTMWILPHNTAREKTVAALARDGFAMSEADFYIAPLYGRDVEDHALLALIKERRPGHVVIALSGGVQEKLGFYLRENCGYRPAIHCIGAALGFVAGYQIAIPDWADRLYLGWLLRLLSQPRKFLPRALNALALPGLIMRYGENMPPLKT
jgi:N-acetylglucosaminyldiphosphoundecaprenol N-acetyl-beta-D-mannosaminyltransferase